MVTINVSTVAPEWDWLRQTPHKNGIWKNIKFVFDAPITSCDYWVVYENLMHTQTVQCSPQNTIIITGEPPSVKTYHQGFLDQFGMVLTMHTNINHRNKIHHHPMLPWMIGYQPPRTTFTQSHTELKNYLPQKTKLLSVICSNKTCTNGHRQRLAFVQILQKHFGDRIDVFGRGFQEVQDKWDAIAPYKYHIALENSAFDDYWTEKITDAFLGWAYPIYYGAPNITTYFPKNSLTIIDVTKPQKAIERIEQTIANNQYEQTQQHINLARTKILDEYQLFPSMTKLCVPQSAVIKKTVTLHPESYFYKHDSFLKKVIRKLSKL